MKIAVVLGTRPEIIKMAPVIRELERRKADFFILHTGQHYSYNLDRVFFEQLELPLARYNLEVGSGSHAEETGKMLVGIEKVLLEKKPDVVFLDIHMPGLSGFDLLDTLNVEFKVIFISSYKQYMEKAQLQRITGG